MKYITTSWDDGHPLDFKIAELLTKYNLPGTFYIPKQNEEHEVMCEKDVQQLAAHFEIGGHTLSHIRLHNVTSATLKYEITGSFYWLTELLDDMPVSFCFPGGAFNKKAITYAFDAGYKVLRTTELLSTASSRMELMPTTIQVLPHSRTTYLKHLIKRGKIANMIRWMKTFSTIDLLEMTDFYLNEIEENDGCFHLWGHSWEIEEHNLWQKLEAIFKHIANRRNFSYVNNNSFIK